MKCHQELPFFGTGPVDSRSARPSLSIVVELTNFVNLCCTVRLNFTNIGNLVLVI